MLNELHCQKHPHTLTRLKCVECGKAICPKCLQDTKDGYKCLECKEGIKKKTSELNFRKLMLIIVVSFVISTIMGFLWNSLHNVNLILSLAAAFIFGVFSAKVVYSIHKSQEGIAVNIVLIISILICYAYNPILIGYQVFFHKGSEDILTVLVQTTFLFFSSSTMILSVLTAIAGALMNYLKT
jgi:hypothetical protein